MRPDIAASFVAGALALSLSLPVFASENSISIDINSDNVPDTELVDEVLESDIEEDAKPDGVAAHDVRSAKDAIVTGVSNMDSIIDVSQYMVVREDFGNLYDWFYDDVVVGKGIWNVDGPLRWSYDSDGYLLYIRPTYKVSNKTSYNKMQNSYESAMKEILAYVPTSGNAVEKAKAVFDAVCDRVTYSTKEETYSFSNYGALVEKRAYCEGYAKLMVDALSRVGIEARMRVNDDHAWNIVNIGGKWYNLDATLGDSYGNRNALFFLKSDSAFKKQSSLYANHVNDGITCNASTYDNASFAQYPLNMSTWNVKISGTPVFTGSARTLSASQIAVTKGSRKLISGTDYAVTYKNNVKAGTATVVLTGKGSHTGTITKTFKISPAKLSSCNVSGVKNLTYTGKALKQSPVLKLGSYTLKYGTDYTLSYKNNVKAGKAIVTITGKGNFTGIVKKTFTIAKRSISSAKISKISAAKYTGKAIKPKFKLTYNGTTLKSGKDYTVKYSNNVKRGTAKIIITGKGNFKGKLTKTFRIK